MKKITNKEECTAAVLNLRGDITFYTNDKELAKTLQISLLTMYKRLAFSDWKQHEMKRVNEIIETL